MAVDIEVLSGSGAWVGATANIESYTLSEEANARGASDTAGAVSSLTFSVVEAPATRLLAGTQVRLKDTNYGTIVGEVVGLQSSNGVVNVEVHNPLARIVGYINVSPYNGTLGGYLSSLMGLAGVTPTINATIAAIPFAMQQYEGDRWELIKQLGGVYGFEVAYTETGVVVRPVRQTTVTETNLAELGWETTRNEQAREVTVTYTNDTYVTDALVWPPGGWTQDTEVLTVGAGETVEQVLETTVSIMSIKQPTAQTFVSMDYAGPNSVYTIAGSDGLPIAPALWEAYGGKVSVSVGPDSKTITVRMTGAALDKYSPFTLSVNSGTSDAYSTLRLVGTGVATNPGEVTVRTGAREDQLNTVEGTGYESPAVRTYAQALDVARDLASRQVGFTGRITGQAVALGLSTQAFGYVAGARVKRKDAVYKITEAQISAEGITYSAEEDTTMADFNAAYGSMTIAQFNTLWADKTIQDFNLSPLGPP